VLYSNEVKVTRYCTFNEVLKKGNTFTFNEVKFSPFLSTFTSLQVTLYSLQCSLQKSRFLIWSTSKRTEWPGSS